MSSSLVRNAAFIVKGLNIINRGAVHSNSFIVPLRSGWPVQAASACLCVTHEALARVVWSSERNCLYILLTHTDVTNKVRML